jgi:DNA-binding NtrC family response regulator
VATIDIPITSAFGPLEKASDSAISLVEHKARILSISGSRADHSALRRIIDDTQWEITTAGNCREAQRKLPYIGALVIFSESSLPDGTWKDVLELTSTLDEPPVLVVTSRLADDFLWSEVLNLGGYDVLLKPLVKDEVWSVLASIWSHRIHPHRHTRVLSASS